MNRTRIRYWTAAACICAGPLLAPGCGEETQEEAAEIKEGAGEVVDEFTGKRSIDRGELIKRDLVNIQK